MASRSIVTRIRGRSGHKIVNRMFSPGDHGRSLKPFVFLDFLSGQVGKDGLRFGLHPHSGQQTLTYCLNAPVHYTDTEGVKGILQPGGLEYMNPGGGAWHESNFYGSHDGLQAFQFWFASPPGIEDGPSSSVYLDPKNVPAGSNFKVLMGEYQGFNNPFPNPSHVNILDVQLKAGDVFNYIFPEGHSTSFVFVYQGAAKMADDDRDSTPQEIFLLDSAGDTVDVKASLDDTRIIIASAVPHKWSLSLGMYSVHTNPESLSKGEARINKLGEELARKGLLK